LKSLFHAVKDRLKCKATTHSNQLPPHIQRYGQDYVNVYDVISDSFKMSDELKSLRLQQQRDKLFYDMKLEQATRALKEIRAIGSMTDTLSTEAQIADEALKRIEIG
jgi:hypothetical protein